MVEWYDFTLYLYLTPVTSLVFIGGAKNSVIATLGVFAVSYVMRPVGAAVFGHFGDRIGRRNVLFVSMTIMTAAMLFTGMLPTRAAAGLLAPVLLFALRGGERRGRGGGAREQFATAGRLSGLALGYTLATAAFGGLAPLVAQQVIDATGWRLFPGLLVMLVALGVLPVLWRLPETARLPLSGSVAQVTIPAPRQETTPRQPSSPHATATYRDRRR
jgi:MHS family proline/betaine transporter-like MFS transporter